MCRPRLSLSESTAPSSNDTTTCLQPFSSYTLRQQCPSFPSPSHPLRIHIYSPPLHISISFSISISISTSAHFEEKMGICTSIDAASISTAKLILPDGTLQQYTYPVKAHYVLQRLKNAAFCICNSDEMDFNDVVFALREDEVLQLGELYFVLPLSYLKRPLKAAEMAELAVRASAALMESSGGNAGNAWLSDQNVNVNVNVNVNGMESDGKRRNRRRATEDGGRRRRGRTYSTDLSAIAE